MFSRIVSRERFIHIDKSRTSLLEQSLRSLPVATCQAFLDKKGNISPVHFMPANEIIPNESKDVVNKEFPHLQDEVLEADRTFNYATEKRIGVFFSGGPASGGNNVLAGIKKALGKDNTLLGIMNGPDGLINGNIVEITNDNMTAILNTGGFDLLGTSRTKIKKDEQFEKVLKTVQDKSIDGIIVIGGDDSNTNAAILAEYFEKQRELGNIDYKCTVVGVPKTIDGDLQVPEGNLLPISFGHDTSVRTFGHWIGNLLTDAASAGKYWHFVKIMGRTASFLTMGVAFLTKPHITLISEEIEAKRMSMREIIDYMVKIIAYRASQNKNSGVALIPEGLIEFVPEMQKLIEELNDTDNMSVESKNLWDSFPEKVKDSLLLGRDPHGNLKVSQIQTDVILTQLVESRIREIQDLLKNGDKDIILEYMEKFSISTQKGLDNLLKFDFQIPASHFYGYEGRSGAPTRFDAAYAFNLGLTAGSLVLGEYTGYMASVTDIFSGGRPVGIPLISLIHLEEREGKQVPVIKKTLVDIKSKFFKMFEEQREEWSKGSSFINPGPIQYYGPTKNRLPMIPALNVGVDPHTPFNLGDPKKIIFEEDS